MPNVNLTDSRQRDAVVKAEATGVTEDLRYVDDDGNNAYTRKILKATVDHDYSTLVQQYEDDKEKLAQAIVEGDPEIDMEKCGLFLWGVSKVYVDSEDGIVYRIEQTEIVRDPNGAVKEKRARQRSEANVDMEIPLTWTGRNIDKSEAVRRFVFSSKLQIVHINGLTYDFLFGMAKELAESNSMMMLGGGSKGRDPLIFRSGSIPYRGFLEGRVDGEKYILLLHLSNMELKQFGEPEDKAESEETASKDDVQDKTIEVKDQSPEPEKVEEEKKEEPASASDEVQDKPEPVKAKKTEKKQEKVAEEKTAESPEVEVVADKPNKNKNKKPKAKKSDEKTNKNKKEKSADKQSDNRKEQPASEIAEDSKVAESEGTQIPVADGAISSQDLGVWLKSIRMGKYLALFVENEIDVDVLSELTDDDLKELEIPLGSRRRLLKAVAETDNLRAEVAMAVQTMSGTKVSSGKKQGH